MPFAPSVIDEGAALLFHDYELGKSDYTDQFMTITYNVKKEWQNKLQAAVHVDDTARPQIVTETQNPSYYKILKKYYELSGIPAFVNTSFNTHEEPIVMTPDDAIRSFLSETVDLLAIGDFIVENK
jgi:carbamoyltransferase